MPGTYTLKDRKPVRCDDLERWARWFGSADRVVARWTFGDTEVSTVFIGVSFDDPPLQFETMVFGGQRGGQQWRYAT